MNGDGDGDGDGVGRDLQLPQEVLMEILKRLPMKLLLRLRCVCRSWRSAIDHPTFGPLHSRHSALDPSNWYLVCLDYRDGFQGTCSLVPYDSLTLPFQLGVRTPFDTPIRFVGSCNGLIGVAEFSRNREGQYMYLWNLFTRKHKAVRLYPPWEEPRFLSKEANREFVGIGFDARSNNYKIVRILHIHVDGRWIGQVGIYSLRTDSWRSLECEVPAFRYEDKAVFLNGNLYWVAFKLDDKLDDTGSASEDASLFMFDLVREVFYEMALPEETFQNKNKSASLKVSVAVLNESLTVFIGAEVSEVVEDYDLYYFVCSVWVMRESWTKLYTFQNPEVVERFYGWMCDELLMEIPRLCSSRISWNWITGSFKVLPLPGTTDLVPVVENLVSPEI